MEIEEDPRSLLVTIPQLQECLELLTSDRDAAQAVAAGLRDAKAPNTRRAYQTAWKLFCDWTLLTDRQAMPAAPQTVALYLGHLAAEGKSLATINQARAAISHAHAAEGISRTENPARHPVVAEAIKGWRNVAPAPHQVDGLTTEALTRIRETARLPRRGRGGRMESEAVARARGAVDLAIIGVMSDGGLRRSEAEALTWEDVEFWADGTARITIQKGKNQPEPATVAVTETTARALREIQPDGAGHPISGERGVRPDRRGPGQTGEGCGQSCGLGQRVQRSQRTNRHGPTDGGCRGADRCGPAPGPVAARGHGRPVHPGRVRWGSSQVAELTKPTRPQTTQVDVLRFYWYAYGRSQIFRGA